ncbi:MAG: hypothetical protein IJP71_03380 [Lachnospiraceae bacterium]|nr:hypothetical protein [Lachnospiraceae bacterium]
MAKKALCLVFAFLLSIESFAAAVSDNDGAAFITKAEFDSLKNDFQSQIDQYNTSIDSKIDAAIASYLNGIVVTKQVDLNTPYGDYKIDDGQATSTVAWYGGSTGANVSLATDREVPNNLITTFHNYRWNNDDSRMYYSLWDLRAVWEYDASEATTIKRTLTRDKKYVNFVVCNADQNLIYFANLCTVIYQTYFTTQMNVSDWIGTLTTIDQYKIGDDWNKGQRMLHARADTEINTKFLTALCPVSTTEYYYVEKGANKWGGRQNTTQQFQNWYHQTLVSQDDGATTCPSMYSINGIYWYETESAARKKRLNEFKYQNLLDVSSYNAEIKYGLYVATTTKKDCTVKVKVNVTRAGTIKLRTAVNNGNASESTEKISKEVVVGENTLELKDLDQNTNIFIVYIPTGTAVGYINDIKLVQETEE